MTSQRRPFVNLDFYILKGLKKIPGPQSTLETDDAVSADYFYSESLQSESFRRGFRRPFATKIVAVQAFVEKLNKHIFCKPCNKVLPSDNHF